MIENRRLAARWRLGFQIFLGLAVLTILEYVISVALPSGTLIPLVPVAVAKAALILRYFMHVGQLWRLPEDDHD